MKDTLKKIGIALAMSAVTLASAQAAKFSASENGTKAIDQISKSTATSSSKKNSLY